MIGSRLSVLMAASVLMVGAFCLGPATGAESESAQAEDSEASDSPRSPIRVGEVEFDDATGTLKITGTAKPGSAVYIYMDDQPLAKLITGDDGTWTLEKEADLGDAVHKVRVEQYDETTRMLAARAMFSIGRAKPGADGASPPASEP